MEEPTGLEISVVVSTHNRREIVLRALQSLFDQDHPASRHEIIVVDDGSSDGTANAIRTLRPVCRFSLIEQENRGPSAARNRGFRAASSGLVLFVDDDMLCDRKLISAHVAAHADASAALALGALFLSPETPPSLAAECFNREIGAFHLQWKQSPGTTRQSADCVFSNASVARSVLEQAGGFDETFRMREDLELGFRLQQAGISFRYVPEAITYQVYLKTSADLIRDAKIFAVGDALFARKHPESLTSGHLSSLRREPRWKRRLQRIGAQSPAMVDLALSPVCLFGGTFIRVPAFRNAGVWALQARRKMRWLHAMMEQGVL